MSDLHLLAAFLLACVAVGRASRLAVHDDWPPATALRVWWFNQTIAKGGSRARWAPILTSETGTGCPFCFAPYAAAVNLTWFLLAWQLEVDWLLWAWWITNAWAAVSYLAAMLVIRDEG